MDFYSRGYLSELDGFLFALYHKNMEVILRTTDITQIPYVKMLLASGDIETYVFDHNISMLEGSINIFPVRLMVLKSDLSHAKEIVIENGILTS